MPPATFTAKEIDLLSELQHKEWGSAKEVRLILRKVNNREINEKSLGDLHKRNKLRREPFDERTYRYYLPDAWNLRINEDPRRGNRTNHHPKSRK